MTKEILPQSYNVKIKRQGIWVTLGDPIFYIIFYIFLSYCHVMCSTLKWEPREAVSQARKVIQRREIAPIRVRIWAIVIFPLPSMRK